MANITKSFNFRNGVQVDDDNLLVNPSGLVGIGTTIPTEALDVRGDAVVSGIVSATSAKFDTLEVSDLTLGSAASGLVIGVENIIGAGVSIRAGIISAHTSQAGVVTYYGDGGKLNNIPTSQWKDLNTGLGFTSIYNSGFVGVATDDPRFALQIAGSNNLSNFIDGVGINSDGGVVATGIVTAGEVHAGQIIGNVSSGISTIGLSTALSIDVVGIVTAGIGFTGDIRGNVVSGVSTFIQVKATNSHASGVSTSGSFVGPLTGDVTGNVTGDVAGNIVGLAGTFTGDVEISGGITGVSTVIASKVTTTNATLGISTASTFSATSKLAVGKAIPVTEVDVFTTGDTKQTLVGSESAALYLGQRVNTGIGESVSGIRFGSSLKTFEIINGDVGDVITSIHGGVFTGINTGSFKWNYGQTNNTLMALDYKGNLGINKQDPETTLDVVGVSTFTGNVKIVGDLDISGTLTGAAAIPDLISGSQIYNNVGMSTFYELDVLQTVKPGKIAIGTERANVAGDVQIDAQRSKALFQSVGIGTTTPSDTLNVVGVAKADTLQSDMLSVGNSPLCAVDFSDAGKNLSGPFSGKTYMVPPKLTTTEIGNLTSVPGGAMVYNTTTNKMQVYNNNQWVNLH
jgi:hypothetical protein